MNNQWCSKVRDNRIRFGRIITLGALAALALLAAIPARADVPAWMRSAASNPIPKYSDETNAVLLYDETTIVVKDAGEVHSIHRRVFRILRPSGRSRGVFDVLHSKQGHEDPQHEGMVPARGRRKRI